MAEVIIRTADLDDIDAIAALWTQLVALHHALDPDLPRAAVKGERRYARRLFDRLDDPDTRVFVADQGGEVVGYVLGAIVDLVPEMFEQHTSGFLADIFVAETHRRAGLGRALVEALTDWFREREIAHFEWNVAARNAEGIAFWRAVGGRDTLIRMRADL